MRLPVWSISPPLVLRHVRPLGVELTPHWQAFCLDLHCHFAGPAPGVSAVTGPAGETPAMVHCAGNGAAGGGRGWDEALLT